MLFNWILYTVCLVLATETSADGLHLATRGLLQIPPSFAGKGISLFPGHHPEHDVEDLAHLVPQTSNHLYYTQEGHRPAIHGAKHGSVIATFSHPTVILDHSNHFRTVKCTKNDIQICFKTPEPFKAARTSWTLGPLNLATYHMGCGDQVSGKRTFFRATKKAVFDTGTFCARVSVAPLDDQEALHAGEVSWGTYKDPMVKKRVPVKGHVRVATPEDGDPPPPQDLDPDVLGALDALNPWAAWNGLFVDLTNNATALKNYFQSPDLETDDMTEPLDPNDSVPFIDSEDMDFRRRDVSGQESFWGDVGDFFTGVWRGIKDFFARVRDFFDAAADTVRYIANAIKEFGIVAAKLIGVPFGVPFDQSYHHDVKLNFQLKAEASNRPPRIFDSTDGYNLAASGKIYSIQCVKCGIKADFSIDGQLAFSIKDGITKGKLTVVNDDAFTIDAQFGITVELQHDTPVTELTHQLAAFPLSPLTIPGIITIGPQLSVGVALDMVLNGKAQLLLGGSVEISSGSAVLSLVDQSENNVQGLSTTFTPVFKFEGAITASAELGLPIGLEVGVDILNGKWKESVGFYHKPSVYALATYSHGQGHKCDDGIELRVGVKDRMYVAALEKWDYDLLTVVIFEKGITCVTKDGFNPDLVEDDSSVFDAVVAKQNTDFLTISPRLKDVASTLPPQDQKTGYRIIMDGDKKSILVSGKDGHLYLVSSEERYDVSAPWGTIDTDSPAVNLDVFGRMVSFVLDSESEYVADLRVFEPDRVPSNQRAAALADLKARGTNYDTYGIIIAVGRGVEIFYPTACKTSSGLRLFATKHLIDKNGNIDTAGFRVRRVDRVLQQFGTRLSDCRTIRLTSS